MLTSPHQHSDIPISTYSTLAGAIPPTNPASQKSEVQTSQPAPQWAQYQLAQPVLPQPPVPAPLQLVQQIQTQPVQSVNPQPVALPQLGVQIQPAAPQPAIKYVPSQIIPFPFHDPLTVTSPAANVGQHTCTPSPPLGVDRGQRAPSNFAGLADANIGPRKPGKHLVVIENHTSLGERGWCAPIVASSSPDQAFVGNTFKSVTHYSGK